MCEVCVSTGSMGGRVSAGVCTLAWCVEESVRWVSVGLRLCVC